MSPEPATVIWQTTIDDWSNPDNQASVPWSSATGRGRYATIRLPEHVRLEEDKTYMAYAIGYQTGTYGNYAPFAGVETGGFYRRTEVASVAPGEHPEEVFAGAEIFFVEGGVIRSGYSALLVYSLLRKFSRTAVRTAVHSVDGLL